MLKFVVGTLAFTHSTTTKLSHNVNRAYESMYNTYKLLFSLGENCNRLFQHYSALRAQPKHQLHSRIYLVLHLGVSVQPYITDLSIHGSNIHTVEFHRVEAQR